MINCSLGKGDEITKFCPHTKQTWQVYYHQRYTYEEMIWGKLWIQTERRIQIGKEQTNSIMKAILKTIYTQNIIMWEAV